MSGVKRILIADDEPLYLRTTGDLLRTAGYECVCVADAEQAMTALRESDFDLVLSDLNMPGNLKLELLHEHHRLRKHVPMIVITGVASLPTAIESIRLGIADYLLKPVKWADLLSSVRRALSNAQHAATAVPSPTKADGELSAAFPEVIGRSRPMLELFEIIDRVAATDTNVLITGESGTGKEVVAKAIHRRSRRAAGNFQVIDCTAVPDALFESLLFGHKRGAFTGAIHDQIGLLNQADGGTAFFDELGELPLPMQAKLLRAVQEQSFIPVGSHTAVRVDTRFICATNRDLAAEVAAGNFRQDLYYRLGVIHIELPPLRARGNDLLLLVDAFLRQFAGHNPQIEGFSPEALELLRSYSWPGNIRELRNVVERTVALARGPMIQARDLPAAITTGEALGAHAELPELPLGNECSPPSPATSVAAASRREALQHAEYVYLVGLMRSYRGNVSEAAQQAGVSRQGLHKLLKQHEIHAAHYRQ